jgi:hypothetical protein
MSPASNGSLMLCASLLFTRSACCIWLNTAFFLLVASLVALSSSSSPSVSVVSLPVVTCGCSAVSVLGA